ncbi:MAG: carboxypeptidase-like regulatory domain-containing protein [Flavobacteriaceae bacterium]
MQSQIQISTIYGQVIDKASQLPIKNAHFTFDSNRGFISDQKGKFKLRINADSVLVKVSCIGYKTEKLRLYKNQPNRILLKPSVFEMKEVVLVSENSAKELVVEMIENIPKNYPTTPEQIVGVTHEEVYMDSLYSKLSYKARVQVLADKFSYSQRNKFGNIQVLDQQTDWDLSITPDVRFYAGVHNVHRFDFVMNKKGVIDIKNIDDYTFKAVDTLLFDDKNVVVIDFENKKFLGSLYILEDSKALIRMEQEKKKFAKEGFPFLKFYNRIGHKVRVDYTLFPDDKWRLKFIQYKTQFKNKTKQDQIFLKNTFSIIEHQPMLKKIKVENRFLYHDVLFDHIVKKDSINLKEFELENKIKFSLIASKIETIVGLGVIPYKSHPYSFLSYIHQDQLISNTAEENFVEVLYFSYSYPLNHFIRFFYSNTASIKSNLYYQNSVGMSTDLELSKRGLWNYGLNCSLGKRSILQLSYEEKFEDLFNLGGKKFDSNHLAYFGTQKEWFYNMGMHLKYRLTGRLALSIGGSYFIPISTTTGLTVVEKGEFWPWNRKKRFLKGQINSEVHKIFDSSFLFQLGLKLKF